ncbi:MAG: hypothetical protein D6803_01835 [Anaerolineae bacterium]|nr:MAG: hypothetical protein D6803_01835 [Anaerolineae bacterium]
MRILAANVQYWRAINNLRKGAVFCMPPDVNAHLIAESSAGIRMQFVIRSKEARMKRIRRLIKGPRWGVVVLLALLGVVVGAFSAGAQFESTDANCALCHTEPETEFVSRGEQSPVDLASQHAAEGVRCIDCHSGDGITGRVQAELLGARDVLVYLSGQGGQPHRSSSVMADANCLKCHSDVLQVRVFNNHFHVFLPQWQAVSSRAAVCVDCHQGHKTNGDVRIAFLNERQTIQVCQRCHMAAGGL